MSPKIFFGGHNNTLIYDPLIGLWLPQFTHNSRRQLFLDVEVSTRASLAVPRHPKNMNKASKDIIIKYA
jgi:hypothetical protein